MIDRRASRTRTSAKAERRERGGWVERVSDCEGSRARRVRKIAISDRLTPRGISSFLSFAFVARERERERERRSSPANGNGRRFGAKDS